MPVRRPRVQITYDDLDNAGSTRRVELPLVIGVLADLAGRPLEPPPPLRERDFVQIHRGNFDEVLARIRPRVNYFTANLLADGGSKLEVELEFARLADFEPARVAARVPPLAALLAARRELTADDAATKVRVAGIDAALTRQLNAILHHPDFQHLEAAWRGLRSLVEAIPGGSNVKVKVFNANRRDLLRDLDRAAEFDQSALFRKVYEQEYGQLGGEPYGLLVGDYDFGPGPDDVSLLTRIARVAAAAHAPFVAAASPAMFGVDHWSELPAVRDLTATADGDAWAAWSSFRRDDDSRYVALTVPRVAIRPTYGPAFARVTDFQFEEAAASMADVVWASAAWAYAGVAVRAFVSDGWYMRTRGSDGGGVADDVPALRFPTEAGGGARKTPLEVSISDRRESELAAMGFMPVLPLKGRDGAVFPGSQSVQKAKIYNDPAATANAELSAKFNYMLSVSRFAHYLKVMARDKIGSMMEVGDVQRWLNEWLNRYVVGNPATASDEVRAQKPLAAAEARVRPKPGKPGWYEAVAYLKPHYQVEAVATAMRLVAEIPRRV